MSSSRLWKTRMQWAPRLISLAVLFGICCSVVPLPVGQRLAKDLSEPFPCQHRACGCRSADQCWKKCCCFTNSQKVAWAKSHRVRLPAAVLASAKRECSLDKQRSSGCCSAGAPQVAREVHSGKADNERDETMYLIGALAQQCRGQPWSWSTLPWAILPQATESRTFFPEVGEKLALCSATSMAISHSPPLPPPRHSDRVSAV